FVITNYYSGSSLPSNTYSPTVRLPYMPQNADISVINDNVMITWEAPTDTNLLTGYRVLRDGVVIFESNALFYLDQELANEDYEYTVRSVYGVAISNPANAGTAHVEVHYVPGPTQAGAYLTTVNLTWAAVSDAGFLINYRIYRDGVQIGTTNVLNYEDTGLANGTYTYSITAVYQNGESIPNTSATVTVDVAYSPNNLQANWEGNTVTLTWLPPTDMLGFVEYKVFRNGLLQNTTSALTYTDLNVSNGIQMYVVGALYANGITAPSIPAMATILVAYDPSNLSGEIQDNDILLTWSAPEDVTGLTAYNVYRDGVLSWTTTQDNTSYLLDNMPNGIYNLSVSAVYGSLESSHTPEITLGLIIAYPVPYLFTDPSDVNEIILGWNAPADTFGLTGYRIWRNGTYLTEQTERSFTDHNLPNGSYVYTLRSVYGSVISDSISTSELVIEYFPLASNVAATAITEGYRISWDAPVTATMPDHYKVFFLREQDTDNQEDWVFVAETDSLSVIDTIHGGYSHGSFIWAVFTFYDEFLAGYELSNVLVVDPAIPPVPEVTKLVGNYPNPFNPETRIVFQLKQNTPVKLQIYNDKGQLIKTLVNTTLAAG
ncbi:MAG TPA: fibronectin type III domain-containing protein, partial [Candidatus Cloacimonadota bacterium]|nr:fibronectin type III domain-containing protein [Candidatus Cloacimonadota bacterium]